MSAPTPFDVWRAAVVAAVRHEIDRADDERWESLVNAYRGIRRTEEGRRMIHDWIGREVILTPRNGTQVIGTLIGVDEYGLTLGDAKPTPSRLREFDWGTLHTPWTNVADTRLAPTQYPDSKETQR